MAEELVEGEEGREDWRLEGVQTAPSGRRMQMVGGGGGQEERNRAVLREHKADYWLHGDQDILTTLEIC